MNNRQSNKFDYNEEAEGLRRTHGDRLVDVVRIWRYRISQMKTSGQPGDLFRLGSALVPELNRLISRKQTDLGLRAEAILTACSLISALDAIQSKEGGGTACLINEALAGISLGLNLPTAAYGRKVALRTMELQSQRGTTR